MNRSLVPFTVIGTKYDEFNKKFEPLQKKSLSMALRYVCHQNGCDLVYASDRDQKPLRLFKGVLQLRTFLESRVDAIKVSEEAGEQPEPLIPSGSADPNNPLFLMAGSDSYRNLVEP